MDDNEDAMYEQYLECLDRYCKARQELSEAMAQVKFQERVGLFGCVMSGEQGFFNLALAKQTANVNSDYYDYRMKATRKM